MSLEEFIQQMNNQPVSTENNQSPLQMWERGMLENMHSGHTAPSPKEIDDLGVDLEGVVVGWELWNNSVWRSKIVTLLLNLAVFDYLGKGSKTTFFQTLN